ncbi:hypothetical protein BKA93DRAFT_884991 [Sparassis latifolia]
MSRPEPHTREYDHGPPYDGRPQGENGRINGRENGHGSRDFGSHIREFSRDGSARDFGPSAGNVYSSGAPSLAAATADRRPLASSTLRGSGFPSFVAPGIFHGSQGIGVGPSDTWSTKPAAYSASPSTARPSADVSSQLQLSLPPLLHNHHHLLRSPSPPRAPPAAELYNSSFHDRDTRDTRDHREHFFSQLQQQQQQSSSPQLSSASPQSLPSPTNNNSSSRSTLWWGELEPWMDEEYAKQVCNLMGWDPVSIKVPRPAPDPITGQQANNPGYCFLTFPSQAHAASVLSQINNSNNGSAPSMTMPNSSKPFSLNWASSVPSTPMAALQPGQVISVPGAQNPQYPKEYSIFVGDLAPEVSNSDLVAVFRNPVLGLRNDREPRFIRPFLSCKSAKIMLDPVTGVSRGYGFVRFTDEADQQRALIEMHGLYCLSRPMRISPATAKFKPVPGMAGMDIAQMQLPLAQPTPPAATEPMNPVTIALPLPNATQTKSVSAPLAGSTAAASGSSSSITSTVMSASGSTSSVSAPSLSSGSTVSSSSTLASTASDEALKAQFSGAMAGAPSATNDETPSVSVPFAQPTQDQLMAQKYNISEESWKHHAQARAILSNLIGPNGEQLTSSDPYNTTVFVGGLSPLISEETLRTFFVPFGDIHYVKVPVGKHCGFVQFVRKPDAERAIEKMQGFPIGGSRIRLSWGRSQYKAAQAAAQAAQAAAFQAQYQSQVTPVTPSSAAPALTPEQALQLLEKLGLTNLLNNNAYHAFNPIFGTRPAPGGNSSGAPSSFSPFSPDPNYLVNAVKEQQPMASSSSQTLRQPAKSFTPWFIGQDEKVPSASGKISPSSAQTIRPPSASQRFLLGEGSSKSLFQADRAASRRDGPVPIARPDVTRKGSQNQEQYSGHDHDHDIQDLNGTLASLDLDHHHSQGIWKNGADGAHALASP